MGPLPTLKDLFYVISELALVYGRISDSQGNPDVGEAPSRTYVIDQQHSIAGRVLEERGITSVAFTPSYEYDTDERTGDIASLLYAPKEGIIEDIAIFHLAAEEGGAYEDQRHVYAGIDDAGEYDVPTREIALNSLFEDLSTDTEEVRSEKERIRFILGEDLSIPADTYLRMQEDLQAVKRALETA